MALAIALVVAWRAQIPNRNDEAYFEELSLHALVTGFAERIGAISESIVSMSLDPARWGYLFWILPLLVVGGWRGLRVRAARVAAICLGAELVLACAGYSVVPDIAIVAVTWNRFLVQALVPLALLVAASARAAIGAAHLREARGHRAARART